MDKKQIIIYAAISFTVVLAGAIMAKALFAWLEQYLFGRKRERDLSLDELIQREERLMTQGKGRPSGRAMAPKDFKENVEDKVAGLLEETTDPKELDKKKILKRIYLFDPKRLGAETEEQFYWRILGLKNAPTTEDLKKSFKTRAKEMHPDSFQLNDFDAKTKKRLEKRIHENYLLIQKAHDVLKKKN
jgi:hypothetical protein